MLEHGLDLCERKHAERNKGYSFARVAYISLLASSGPGLLHPIELRTSKRCILRRHLVLCKDNNNVQRVRSKIVTASSPRAFAKSLEITPLVQLRPIYSIVEILRLGSCRPILFAMLAMLQERSIPLRVAWHAHVLSLGRCLLRHTRLLDMSQGKAGLSRLHCATGRFFLLSCAF